MQRLSTVTSLDVSAVAGHHAMPAALLFSNAKKLLDLQPLTMTYGIRLTMPHLSMKFNEVCTLTLNCDLDLEFGNINIMCGILSNYDLPFW